MAKLQRSALCRSRRELSNVYFLAKFGFDTAENERSTAAAAAENEPCQFCPIEQCSLPQVRDVVREELTNVLEDITTEVRDQVRRG